MSTMLQRRQVPPGQVVGEVVNRSVQRITQIIEKRFARCGKAQTIAEFIACIDSIETSAARNVARAIVLATLRNMGIQYSTWEDLRRNANAVPYKILLRSLEIPESAVRLDQPSKVVQVQQSGVSTLYS